MYIKKMFQWDLLFLVLAFFGNFIFGDDSATNILLKVFIPQFAMVTPFFWFFTYSKILDSADDRSNIYEKVNQLVAGIVMLILFLVFSFLYFDGGQPQSEYFQKGVLTLLIVISNVLGISTAIFSSIAAYTMFIRISARGYRKLMK